ncbi:hypothetical protein A8C32_04830 [Flavivirga aquatica]|uniref:Uncharacterized protein n=1 Tax=Flavivirga aquatica TaxID=1849968 RepID=A0A1E5SHE8_9FLAO|nr:hypothetical protein [Flavivirga aquatica]OEJ98534.1 hypothetical protein A8C32_04830 [Flavivirga aquatica]
MTKRISRPYIIGNIYDENTHEKIGRVQIITWNNKTEDYYTETVSNKNGFFNLLQISYIDKLAIGGEAPMGFYSFILKKKGYHEKQIESKSKHGFTKDTIRYDSIFLTPINKTLPNSL